MHALRNFASYSAVFRALDFRVRILSEDVLNVTQTQWSTDVKRVSQHIVESHGFFLGAPVSSHKLIDRVV